MDLPIYQVDAFTATLFGGNPAAVMPLDHWLADDLLQSIALENNLSETAFFVACEAGYELRWFTPAVEVDLCGHATLAAAHVLFQHLDFDGDRIRFHTRSGELVVSSGGGALTLDFPPSPLAPGEVDGAIAAALGGNVESVSLVGEPHHTLVYVYPDEHQLAQLTPDFPALLAASPHPVIATAAGDKVDFVSRFFGPQVGIDEDPVTGSAHCALVPYWAARLGKSVLQARQISARGGELACELADGRVLMTGNAVTYMQGRVTGLG